MTAKDVIKQNLDFCRHVTTEYLKDLSDADLLVRPVPNANHIAWQLGHLISGERQMVAAMGHAMPELPASFDNGHSKEGAASDDPKRFAKKSEYLSLMQKVRQGTLAALERTTDADLGKPGPEDMRAYAPTVQAVFSLVATHDLMHAGQFVTVRRKLGKPILF
jgi:uncharacterized damage-inducible protein DinB